MRTPPRRLARWRQRADSWSRWPAAASWGTAVGVRLQAPRGHVDAEFPGMEQHLLCCKPPMAMWMRSSQAWSSSSCVCCKPPVAMWMRSSQAGAAAPALCWVWLWRGCSVVITTVRRTRVLFSQTVSNPWFFLVTYICVSYQVFW